MANMYANDLCSWLDAGVSPYHTVQKAANVLDEYDFEELPITGEYHLEAGGKYYVKDGTFLAAFTIGEQHSRFRIAASHTDWPCMRIKPNGEMRAAGCCKLAVEPYGGAILNTWMDRPLSLAGVVMLRTDDPMRPKQQLITWDKPLMVIPNLAIHLNREVNHGVALKPQTDMLPICASVREQMEKDGYLVGKIAERLNVEKESVLSFELCAYCADKAQYVGFNQDFIVSPRLDNITSVHATIDGLVRSEGSQINVAVLYDNEEIGSLSRRGADSGALPRVLEKIAAALHMNRSQYHDACRNGMLLSCDAAHALHPNRMEMADSSCSAVMNRGVALKKSPRYASDAESSAVVIGLCRENEIPLQLYMNRPDLAGGSTVGGIASSALAMPAADVGVPMLAMHSACETMGAEDQESFCRLCEAFYNAD